MKNFIICTLLLFFVACTPRNNITIASTKDIDVKDINLNKLTKRKVHARVCGGCPQGLFAYYTVSGYPPTERALDKALELGKGDLLLDGYVSYLPFGAPWLPPAFVCCTHVEGDVVNTKEAR